MIHYRKTRQTYSKHQKNDAVLNVCGFCNDNNGEQVVCENETMFVIPNRVSYDIFEGRRVLDHMMVIPKQHRASMADFTAKERDDAMLLIGTYEAQGYNVYMRGLDSPGRSMQHQHTHLIKLSDTPSKFILYAHKPYVLIDF